VTLDTIQLEMGGGAGGGGAGGGATGGGSAMGGGMASGGGTSPGGGSGVGGGMATGGGPQTCNCVGGCCTGNSPNCDRGNGSFFTCGEGVSCLPGMAGTCGTSNLCNSTPCNFLSANTCGPQGCQCFNGPACGPGLICTSVGPYSGCVCSYLTCSGCCGADGGCITNVSARECGAAGADCVSCDAGAVTSGCSGGTCGALSVFKCDAGSCLSGNRCVGQQFPRCQAPVSTACYYCDPIVSDRCTALGACGCGQAAACTGNTTCVKQVDGGFRCAPYTNGGG
jgi:hypothetical protein